MEFGECKPNKLDKNGGQIYNAKTVADIERCLINCGFNPSLVHERML